MVFFEVSDVVFLLFYVFYICLLKTCRLNMSTYRPETPPPRMRMSVSRMSLLHKQGSTVIPAPRVLPKVFGSKSMEHLTTTRVLTRFDGIDILKL